MEATIICTTDSSHLDNGGFTPTVQVPVVVHVVIYWVKSSFSDIFLIEVQNCATCSYPHAIRPFSRRAANLFASVLPRPTVMQITNLSCLYTNTPSQWFLKVPRLVFSCQCLELCVVSVVPCHLLKSIKAHE